MSDPAAGAPVALYVHVPLCLSKCGYCDFNSAAVDVAAPVSAGSDTDLGDAYVDAVIAHVEHAVASGVLDRIPSIYIGGGTPTLLGARLVRLVDAVRALPGIAPDAELTVETNPETTSALLVQALAKAGVTRFSLGVQSFDNAVLATLGRRHDAHTAEKAAQVLRDCGRPFSVDLICGVPGQSAASWRESVVRAIATGAGHVSVYPLSIEDGTPLAREIDAGALPEPDADVAADMMQAAAALLREACLERYEVASYARAGGHSRHNTVYWTGGAYLGVGPGAASMMPVGMLRRLAPAVRPDEDVAQDWRARFTWTETLEGILGEPWAGVPQLVETLSPADALREDAMLGMRMARGISVELAEKAAVVAVLESLAGDGLVELAQGRWRPTERGWLLGNEVFSSIWAGE